ncbi:hypothetical protein ABIA32_002537 [Streptacidiphilus sp. MAP12-20]|uniref:hypothetical protein n=1 Tax=Streptacidiphilus sp. MAP12-20 TaxID=3156299 RepID=UPI003517B89E
MHTFDTFPPPRREARAWPAYAETVAVPAAIPAMRPAFERDAGRDTPIYDALYSEFRRLFRSLPGDRTGEESFKLPYFSDFTPPQVPHLAPPGAGRHRSYLSLPPGES